MINWQQYVVQMSILDAWHSQMWACAGRDEADRLVVRVKRKLAAGKRAGRLGV